MNLSIRAAAILMAAALAMSCAVSLEKAVVGRYRAEVDLSGVSESLKSRAQQAASMLNGVSVEIKPDKTLTMTVAGMTVAGTWKIEEGKLVTEMSQGAKFPPFHIEDGGRILRPVFSEDDTSRMSGAQIWLKRE